MLSDTRLMPKGNTRHVENFSPPVRQLTELEQRAAEIEARERAENEGRYRGLIFQYAERDLTDAEVVQLTSLANALGLPASPDEHREAIRAAARIQTIVDTPDTVDFAALEAAVNKTDAGYRHAVMESFLDKFRDLPTDQLAEELAEMTGPNPRPIPRLKYYKPAWVESDQAVNSSCEARAQAWSELTSARNRKPNAERNLLQVKQAPENRILWPD
jgi:hypothetical protein